MNIVQAVAFFLKFSIALCVALALVVWASYDVTVMAVLISLLLGLGPSVWVYLRLQGLRHE
jgi:hypothetical protein